MPEGYPLLHGECMGGGERAPVALCREPTEAGAETRGRVPLSLPARQARAGDTAQPGPTRPKIPAHEVQRDFPGPRCQPPRSAPQRRDFPAPRGHAPRRTKCKGIFLACGANRPGAPFSGGIFMASPATDRLTNGPARAMLGHSDKRKGVKGC